MIFTFDASAMIALANGESGATAVEALLANLNHDCYVHAANMCEVYYDVFRRSGEVTAQRATTDFLERGLRLRADMDVDFWKEAGRLKAQARRVSLADCFGLTLARRLGAEFVTADRHELEPVAGEYKIRFIR